ncbi:MAG: hypothetical protein PHQ70_12420, partial [Arcobacter sp.]|uniref:hypothetical protein n=1 Tax=Arcobacter sp. TaxID=1872629 RepID=UPI002590EB05
DDDDHKRIKDLNLFAQKKMFQYLEPASIIEKLGDFPDALLNEPIGGISKNFEQTSFIFIESNNTNCFIFSDLKFSISEFILTRNPHDNNILTDLGFPEVLFEDDIKFSNMFLLHSPDKEAVLKLFDKDTRASLLELFNENYPNIYAKNNMIALVTTPKVNIVQIPEYIETLNKLHLLLQAKLKEPSVLNA